MDFNINMLAYCFFFEIRHIILTPLITTKNIPSLIIFRYETLNKPYYEMISDSWCGMIFASAKF